MRCKDIPVSIFVLFHYLRRKFNIFSEKRKFIYSMTTQIALVYHLFQYILNKMREKILIINHDDYILPRWIKVWGIPSIPIYCSFQINNHSNFQEETLQWFSIWYFPSYPVMKWVWFFRTKSPSLYFLNTFTLQKISFFYCRGSMKNIQCAAK